MSERTWMLPSGVGLRISGGRVDIRWPRTEAWVALARDLEEAEQLLAVLAVEVPRERRADDDRRRR